MNARQRIERAVERNGFVVKPDADGVPWLNYLPGDGWTLMVEPAPVVAAGAGTFHHSGVFTGYSADEVIEELDYFGAALSGSNASPVPAEQEHPDG